MEATKINESWSRWHLVLALLMVAICMVIASDAWRDVMGIAWHDEESSHILIVPLAVVWLWWVRRSRFSRCKPQGRMLGALLLGVGWGIWSVGYRYQIESFWHGGAVLMAVGGLLSVVGQDVLLNFLPAFAVLVFLVPSFGTFHSLIAVPLQTVTATITQHVAETFGMEVQRRGNLLTVNGQDVAVVEACNGMRMVITLFLACYVFAFITPLKPLMRVLILVLSPVVAIVCNVIRLVPTLWMFGHASAKSANVFHEAAGWVMLVLAFGVLMGIDRAVKWVMVWDSQVPQTSN